MLQKIILCIIGTFIISNTYCFLIKESYNINFEDTGEYKVDDFLMENDYEMIKDNDLRDFKIDNKENKLYLLNVYVLSGEHYVILIFTQFQTPHWLSCTNGFILLSIKPY